MPHVLFSDTHDWDLDDDDQDLRGREVRDANNNPIGVVADMAVDTVQQVVSALILEDGTQFRAADVTLSDDVVYVNSYGAPPGVATRPYPHQRPVRSASAGAVAEERREGDREIAEERAEMRREMREPDRAEEIREGRREIAEEKAEQRREMADAADGTSGFSGYEDRFRTHFQDSFGDDDLGYSEYAPAYRYGYDAAYDDRFRGRDFAASESDLKESYYRRLGYPMSDNIIWSRVKGAVQHAFESVRGAVT